MDAEFFTELALRAIAGEATTDERAALERELSADAERRAEFDQLSALFNAAPMASAIGAVEPALPAHRVGDLRTAVRQQFGTVAAKKKSSPVLNALRWLFAGGGLTGLAAIIVVLCFSNRTIEVGSYVVDDVRSGGEPITQADLPSVKFMTFAYDAQFDAWQNQSLAWYQHAKIWVDNEHDQLHVVRRVDYGHVVSETQPLAASTDGQRDQIRQAVQELSR